MQRGKTTMAAADRSGGWVTTVMGCSGSIVARRRGLVSGSGPRAPNDPGYRKRGTTTRNIGAVCVCVCWGGAKDRGIRGVWGRGLISNPPSPPAIPSHTTASAGCSDTRRAEPLRNYIHTRLLIDVSDCGPYLGRGTLVDFASTVR